MSAAVAGPSDSGRIGSLDQFRGYTVVGMLAVNYLGRFTAIHPIFKHHNTYCSYADTIMPQFFFAVGFAYRLTYLRRRERDGGPSALRHALARGFGLLALGLVFYNLDSGPETWAGLRELGVVGAIQNAFRRDPFQALVHIALTGLWVLPVIAAPATWRVGFMVASALLFLGLSNWFYFDFAWQTPVIDGGPLGFLSWTIPTLVGSLAYDVVRALPVKRSLTVLVLGALIFMLGGYGLSCLGPGGMAELPFQPPGSGRAIDLWTMSQRTGSLSYLTFSAGFSLAVYAVFVVVTDVAGFQLGLFRTFGTNALAAYLLHSMVGDFVNSYTPEDAPLAYVTGALVIYMAICYGFIRFLERHQIYLRL